MKKIYKITYELCGNPKEVLVDGEFVVNIEEDGKGNCTIYGDCENKVCKIYGVKEVFYHDDETGPIDDLNFLNQINF